MTPARIAEARKFLIALAAFAAVALSSGLLHGQVAAWVSSALAALGALGVYTVPNKVKD